MVVSKCSRKLKRSVLSLRSIPNVAFETISHDGLPNKPHSMVPVIPMMAYLTNHTAWYQSFS